MDGTHRIEHATYLGATLREFDQEIKEILESNSVKEVLEQVKRGTEVAVRHPPSILVFLSFRWPGVLTQFYNRCRHMSSIVYPVVYPVVYSALNAGPQKMEDDEKLYVHHTVEMCRSFAEDNADILYPVVFSADNDVFDRSTLSSRMGQLYTTTP